MNTNIKSEKIGLTEKVINFFKSSDNQKKFSKDINTIVRLHSENPEKIERLLDVLRRYPIDPQACQPKS
jgi:hypothetical protein